MSLEPIADKLLKLRGVPGIGEKLRLASRFLEEDPDFKRAVVLAYHPMYRFFIKTAGPLREGAPPASAADIFAFMERIAAKRSASDADRAEFNRLFGGCPATRWVMELIAAKDLDCGLALTSWKKLLPVDLKLFSPTLATGKPSSQKAAQWVAKWLAKHPEFLLSEKFNGARAIAIVSASGAITYLSRHNIQWRHFGIFDGEVLTLATYLAREHRLNWPIILDGEVIDPKNTVSGAIGAFQQNNPPREAQLRWQFHIFDLVLPNTPIEERLRLLGQAYAYAPHQRIHLVEHTPVMASTPARILSLAKLYFAAGKEGIILKAAKSLYTGTRSPAWLKLKRIYLEDSWLEADLKVLDFDFGAPGTKYADTVGALVCRYKNRIVRVASGLSDYDRARFLECLPRMIAVKAEGETDDGSLQNPVFLQAKE